MKTTAELNACVRRWKHRASVLRWKDGEFLYCAKLVRDGGDPPRVSREQVRSYLTVQILSADKEPAVMDALEELLEIHRLLGGPAR